MVSKKVRRKKEEGKKERAEVEGVGDQSLLILFILYDSYQFF
jgi:hypothetical protein